MARGLLKKAACGFLKKWRGLANGLEQLPSLPPLMILGGPILALIFTCTLDIVLKEHYDITYHISRFHSLSAMALYTAASKGSQHQ